MKQGCAAILQLGNADASYRATPSYGLALLRSGKKNEFNAWATRWKADLQNIKNDHLDFGNFGNLQDEIKSLKEQIAALREVHKVLSKGGTEAERVSVEKKLDEKIKQSDALNALEERLNQNPLYNLMQRITTDEISKDGNEVWGTKDIKVSQEEYRTISEALQGTE
jgi:tRNA nucleotidyltransferase/poly(A) polymerase